MVAPQAKGLFKAISQSGHTTSTSKKMHISPIQQTQLSIIQAAKLLKG